jgi:transposase InsO family protein
MFQAAVGVAAKFAPRANETGWVKSELIAAGPSLAYCEEVLSAYLFDSLDEVRDITADWLDCYNETRPHDALGSLPAARYRERLLAAERCGRASATRSYSSYRSPAAA